MKAKRFIISTLSVLLAGLLLTAGLQIAVDPLFQYHTPWFGTEPVLTDERYQYAGIAKNFEYDNVIVGNSFSENFKPSVFDRAFGGKTVKLAISGSTIKDWELLLNIIHQRAEPPKFVFANIDPYSLLASSPDAPGSVPVYLYDDNLFNDTGYFYNFGTLSIALNSIRRNVEGTVPDADTVFLQQARGKETVIADRDSIDAVEGEPSIDDAVLRASGNLDMLLPYVENMPDTEFCFFFTPVSILYWYKVLQEKNADCWYAVSYLICEKLLQYPNVRLYLWTDEEMLGIISGLDSYVDEAHCSPEVCELLTLRMRENEGLLSPETYGEQIDKLFAYTAGFDYASLLGEP